MILKKNDGWYLFTKDGGRELGGPYHTMDMAEERKRQIEFFEKFKQRWSKS